jgi:hypothetical protein
LLIRSSGQIAAHNNGRTRMLEPIGEFLGIGNYDERFQASLRDARYFASFSVGLLELIAKHIADGRVLALIEGFLKAGVMEGMESWEPEEGTPQGGVISPTSTLIHWTGETRAPPCVPTAGQSFAFRLA